MQAQREPLDAAEAPSRAAEELAEVVARDVLHDLAARVRARAVREQYRDAEHEVAHRSEAMTQRAGEIVDETIGDRRVTGWVERQALPVLRERPLQSGQQNPALDDARQVARLVLDDLRTALQARPSRAGE